MNAALPCGVQAHQITKERYDVAKVCASADRHNKESIGSLFTRAESMLTSKLSWSRARNKINYQRFQNL